MEEEKQIQEQVEAEKPDRFHELSIKYLPYIISIFVILMTGLSFIGNLFTLNQYLDGEKINSFKVTFFDLLFSQNIGVGIQVLYIIIYLVLPIIASVLLVFHTKHKHFVAAAMFIFLIIGMVSIVTRDIYQEAATSFFNKGLDDYPYSCKTKDLTFIYALPILCYFVSFALSALVSFNNIKITTRDITEMGVLIAAALGLNFIKVMPMPTGGSLNLQMVPLFFLALRRGPVKGFFAGGIVYGLISCLFDGYGFACYPFDYMLGFGSIAIFGFFSPLILKRTHSNYTTRTKRFIFFRAELFLLIAGTISTALRFMAGTISSMVVYGYDLVPALAYNSLYVFASGGLSLLVIMLLLEPIRRINNRYPVERINVL